MIFALLTLLAEGEPWPTTAIMNWLAVLGVLFGGGGIAFAFSKARHHPTKAEVADNSDALAKAIGSAIGQVIDKFVTRSEFDRSFNHMDSDLKSAMQKIDHHVEELNRVIGAKLTNVHHRINDLVESLGEGRKETAEIKGAIKTTKNL